MELRVNKENPLGAPRHSCLRSRFRDGGAVRLSAVDRSRKRRAADKPGSRSLHGKLPTNASQAGNRDSRLTGQASCEAA